MAVEMIKSTDTAAEEGTQRPPPSSPSPPGKTISVDTVDGESLSNSKDAAVSNGSGGAPDIRLGGEVDLLDDAGGDGKLGIVDMEESESMRGCEGAMPSAGAEENRS